MGLSIFADVVDVWYRICSQRKSALRDTNNLELSMQVVLSHGHDLLNKRKTTEFSFSVFLNYIFPQ